MNIAAEEIDENALFKRRIALIQQHHDAITTIAKWDEFTINSTGLLEKVFTGHHLVDFIDQKIELPTYPHHFLDIDFKIERLRDNGVAVQMNSTICLRNGHSYVMQDGEVDFPGDWIKEIFNKDCVFGFTITTIVTIDPLQPDFIKAVHDMLEDSRQRHLSESLRHMRAAGLPETHPAIKSLIPEIKPTNPPSTALTGHIP